MKITPEEIKLTPYEEEIERRLEAGEFKTVENLEEWKKKLQKAAERTLKKLEQEELKVRFRSPEHKKKAIELLKQYFGDEVEIVST